MDLQHVNYAITLFTGYLQKHYTETVGLLLVDNHIRQVCNGRADVRVSLCSWNAEESDVAETVWRLRPQDKPQHHGVIGYSYGGDRAVKFCREILERGDCDIDFLILVDPVVRWDRLPGIAASFGIGKHHVPAQVKHVQVFAQKAPRWKWRQGRSLFEPAGHPVMHGSVEIAPTVMQSSHTYIDNARVVRNACVKAAKQMLGIAEDS